jgi:hypothetical protein
LLWGGAGAFEQEEEAHGRQFREDFEWATARRTRAEGPCCRGRECSQATCSKYDVMSLVIATRACGAWRLLWRLERGACWSNPTVRSEQIRKRAKRGSLNRFVSVCEPSNCGRPTAESKRPCAKRSPASAERWSSSNGGRPEPSGPRRSTTDAFRNDGSGFRNLQAELEHGADLPSSPSSCSTDVSAVRRCPCAPLI